MPYDAVRDFAPVSQVAVLPNVLVVHPSVPAKTVKELIALARARPAQLTYASAGVGSNLHLTMELIGVSGHPHAICGPPGCTAPGVTRGNVTAMPR
jgi:tripartite-type tricarboxylate transporter receptor subunit TctC